MKELKRILIVNGLLLIIPVFLLILLLDASRYDKNINEIDQREVICWITQQFEGVENCSDIPNPSSIDFVSQEELEAALVEMSSDKDFMRAYIDLRKEYDIYIKGFYNIESTRIYISEKESPKNTYVHEMAHHVISILPLGFLEEIDELRGDRDKEELKVRQLARQYLIEHHWSCRILSRIGMY